MYRSRIFFTFALIAIFLSKGGYAEEKPAFRYQMSVRIEPALHRLAAEVRIQQPPSSHFYLQKGFTLRQAMADGHKANYHSYSPDVPSMLTQLGTPTVLDAESPHQLYLKYDGEIQDPIWECNMIAPQLVELALYSAWFPLFDGWKEFEFEMEIDLPDSYIFTTNGLLQKQREEGGRSISSWTSFAPGVDMVLMAAPRLQQQKRGNNLSQAEIYYDRFPNTTAKDMLEALLKAYERLNGLYGPPQVKGMIRLVYSPRKGQGYSRIPLIIISEERALQTLKEPFGRLRDLRHNCHELAHFWWMLADPYTPDDWINEGLAEFSAFCTLRELFGEKFAQMRLGEYREHASNSQTTTAIAETEQSSPDREINRYDKTTLMLLDAQQRFGVEKLNELLQSLYKRFAGNRRATTALFLEEADKQMGKPAQEFFREALYRKSEVAQPAKTSSK